MSRAIGPSRGLGGSDVVVPFTVLGLCWLPVALFGTLWVGGTIASRSAGDPGAATPFGWDFAAMVLRSGVGGVWPETSPLWVWTCTVGIALLAVLPGGALAAVVRRRQGDPADPLPSLASASDLGSLTPAAAVRRARQLRAGLGADPAPSEIGVALGRLRTRRGAGPELRASWEDVLLAVMAPRAGKTTALAVPAILDAPGAVVATSNKADLWTSTATLRAERTDQPVWVFDPQQIAYAPRSWWWNPLRGVTTVQEAHRLAGHFIQEIKPERGAQDFWSAAAHDLLTSLLLAAGTAGRPLGEVYEWINDPDLRVPVDLLRDAGLRGASASLLSRMHGAQETRDGIYETARTATQCLRDDAILSWVSPGTPELAELDAAAFATSRQTLHLLSKDGAGAAAPLVAALTDRILREAVLAAERAGGRLDPPLLVVLDEAANVCRIADLPDLYSHLGSRGITPLTILQSYKQGTRVWGEHGMDSLWSAATVKLLGAGLDDARLTEDLSRLIGDHDVTVRAVNRGDRNTSESLSLRRQRILGPEQIRALPRGSTLLLATGCRAALINLAPWYSGAQADTIRAAQTDAVRQLTDRARATASKEVSS